MLLYKIGQIVERSFFIEIICFYVESLDVDCRDIEGW